MGLCSWVEYTIRLCDEDGCSGDKENNAANFPLHMLKLFCRGCVEYNESNQHQISTVFKRF